MPGTDIFVSYTSLRFYKSRKGTVDNWPLLFRDGLIATIAKVMKARGTQAPAPSVYAYEGQAPGDRWQDNLATVGHAKALVPILSETYFESPTCFLEWHAFVTRSFDFGRYSDTPPDLGRPIFSVWRFEDNTAKDVDKEKNALKELVFEGVGQRLIAERHFPPQQARSLTEAWIDQVFARHAIDLSPWTLEGQFEKDYPAAEMEKLGAALAHALFSEDWTPEHEKLLALSLFALGTDRFHAGGWGFSMGADFERDDDGRLLIHGRDELNQLVIRALRSTIGVKEAFKEEEAALLFWRSSVKSINLASSPVKDRKQRVVSLASLLQSSMGNSPVRDEMIECIEHLKGEVHHEPFTQRWVLEPTVSKRYHQVAFFDFAARIKHGIEVDAYLARKLDNGEVDRSYESAKNELQRWLLDNNVFLTLKERFFSRINTESEEQLSECANSREITLLLINLRMLCTLKPSAEMISDNKTFQALLAIRRVIDELVPRLKQPGASQALLEAFVRVFPLLLLSVRDLAHHTGNDDERSRSLAQALQSHWDDLIRSLGAVRLGAAMNAAGWAATILGFERSGRCSENERLRRIWVDASNVREARQKTILHAVAQVEQDARTTLTIFVTQEIASLCRELGLAEADAALDQLRPLFTFGAEPRRLATTSDAKLGQAVGLLLVDAASDKVLSATAGFNEIYISPFSSRLGIGLTSLERLIYELGDKDEEFIAALSDSIVIKCWSLDDSGNVALEEFAERSSEVREELLALPPHEAAIASRRDLLQLRIDANGASRIVLRTCSLVREDDLIGVSPAVLPDHRAESRRIVLWTFMDISGWEKSGALDIVNKIEMAK